MQIVRHGDGGSDTLGEVHQGAAIRYDGSLPLTIVLMGNNSVTHAAGSGDASAGILIANNADLTIAGTGSLTVAGGNASYSSSGVVSMSGNVTISGGKVIATGGSGQYSAGILGGDVVISDAAEVDATGDTSNVHPGSSAGIAVSINGISISNSKVTATGNSAQNSYGIRCASTTKSITISGASTVEATGGAADNTSCGIYSGVAVGISGSSQVNATGGNAQSGSHGIYGRDSVTISDEAKVEASGSADGTDTYGISCDDGSISIDGGEVTATGSNKACGGTVKNATLGMGWTDTAGTQGKAAIEASAEGQTLAYKRVQFPASMATVTKAPEPKDLTYTGSAQELVTAGTAEGGTMQYSLNGDTWSEAVPTGTDVGEYTVWYKAAGDANHNDIEPQKVTSTIAKPADAVALTGSGHVQTYGDVAAKASGKGIAIGTMALGC